MQLELTLPIPPSINHCYFYIKGKRIPNKTAKDYMELVKQTALKTMQKNEIAMFPDKKKIIIEMTYHFPDKRIRDTHNTFKILLDALEGVVYKNDYWVLVNIKDFIIEKGKSEVHLNIYLKDNEVKKKKKGK